MVKTASPAARRELGRVKAMGQNSMLAMAQNLSTWEVHCHGFGAEVEECYQEVGGRRRGALPMMSMLR